MADTFKFVDEIKRRDGTGRDYLDINDGTNYCVASFEAPYPPPDIEWRDFTHRDGREVSRFNYPNIEIEMVMQVYGADREELSDNIKALFNEFNRTVPDCPILKVKYENWTDPLFYYLVPPAINFDSELWWDKTIRDNRNLLVLPNLEIKIEALPFAKGERERIVLLQSTSADTRHISDSFEDAGANWDVTETNAGTVTFPSGSGDELDGDYCCKLTTTGAGSDVAAITDKAYRDVGDVSLGYPTWYLAVYTKKLSGTAKIDVDIDCYDEDYVLLGTLNLLVADDVSSSWENPIEFTAVDGGVPCGGIINSAAPGGDLQNFIPDTRYVKLTVRNDSTVASVVAVDSIWFGCTKYCRWGGLYNHTILHGKPSNPCMFRIPSHEIKGNVPAFCRIDFSNYQYSYYDSFDDAGWSNILYLGCGHGLSVDSTLLLRPSGGSSNYAINFTDQCYQKETGYTSVPGFFGTPVFHFNPDNSTFYPRGKWGRLQPVAKIKASASGTIQLSLRTYSDSVVYDKVNYVGTGWILSGIYKDGSNYCDPLPTISVPPNDWDYVDGDYEQYAFYLDFPDATNDDVYLDYLLLVPLNGYGKVHVPGCVFYGMRVDDGLYLYNESGMPAGVAGENTVGEFAPMVHPALDTDIVFLLTDETNFDTQPRHMPEVILYYDPMWLLTPEL